VFPPAWGLFWLVWVLALPLRGGEGGGAALVFRDRPGGRVADLTLPATGRTGFTLMSREATGVRFTNAVALSRSLTNHILLNGSGVAAGDVDGDGLCDLYFCGIDNRNALYRNLGGWRFAEIAAAAGVDCSNLDATGVVLADLDGDRDLDLLVSAVRGGVRCFANDGIGRFKDVTAQSGLASTTAGMSMTLADIDGDGDLDLYVANYRNETLRDAFQMRLRVGTVDGKRVVRMVNGRTLEGPDLAGWVTLDAEGNISENGQADILYRNEGELRFTPIPFTGGAYLDEAGRPLTTPLYDWTLSAMFRDLNGDGLPDLYVCSDLSSPDRIWFNLGDGRFRAAPPTAFRKTSWFSMGVDCADLNRDGYDEIFVTDMVSRDHRLRQVQVSDHQPVFAPVGVFTDRPQAPRNTLFLNCGDGDWLETAYAAGLAASEWSWSPVFLDVDLDGYEDVLIATGFERDVQDADIANQLEAVRRERALSDAEALRMRAKFPRLSLPKLAFRNRGDLTFEETGAAWGFADVGVSQGMALADLDNDGDLDVIVNNMNGVAGLYRNDSPAPRVAVRLRGAAPNTRGVGARIRVLGGAVAQQSQEIQSGGRYLSSDDSQRVFAAGAATNRMTVEVTWRSGRQSRIEGVSANQAIEVDETGAAVRAAPPASGPAPWFEDLTGRLNHTHLDEEFDDFARQPLLPRKLSQLGPGVAWFDMDGDGWDDLVVGAGKAGSLAVFHNNQHGGFDPATPPAWARSAVRDQGTVLGVHLDGHRRALLVGNTTYEDAATNVAAVQQFAVDTGAVTDLITGGRSSAGPLALGDCDGDGDLDLFIGGRVVPGRYPEPAASRLFRNEAGAYREDVAAGALLSRAGLVSGAVWTDLDGDALPELVLACEWGPVRVFRRSPTGGWVEQTREWGLDPHRGWWNGVAAGDLDGDGRMDLVASNWGSNNKYAGALTQPLRIYYGDFNGGGEVDLIEAYSCGELGKIVPWLHLGRVGPALPLVGQRYATFRAFGEASVADILGEKAGAAQELQAGVLDTVVLLNRGGRFDLRALPFEAQLTPAFAVCVADIDNDGREDVFLSQNFFPTEPETARQDAGRGLWMLGDGRGGFRVLPAVRSGVRIYGEQRGAAVGDFDQDGRVDLCVAQNGAATRLFRNRGAPKGLRVRLHGPAHNPTGVGAQLRLGRPGPTKEIHAGSGYWSQNSAVAVFPAPAGPVGLSVRWPGGKVSQATVPPGPGEVTVSY
jgi:hypothetical protein